MVLPNPGESFWSAVGLRGVGVGGLLGLGSCGECLLHALAGGDGIPSFGDDPGEEGDVKGMEHRSDHLYVSPNHFRHLHYPQWHHFLRTYLRSVVIGLDIPGIPGDSYPRIFQPLDESLAQAEKPKRTGFVAFKGEQLSL